MGVRQIRGNKRLETNITGRFCTFAASFNVCHIMLRFLTSAAFIALSGFFTLNAQNPGCDGSRYKQDVFTASTKTTVVYAPTIDILGDNINLSMDIYQPEGDNLEKRPLVVLAHGGSFTFGDKSLMERWCRLLAKKGYVAASIQYRLFPFFVLGIPDSTKIFDTAVKAMGDMKAAVRYFREDAATANKFHIDPDNIFIGGYSAGAVTALHAGFIDANDTIPTFLKTLITANGGLEGKSGTASNFTYSSKSKAIVNMSGGLYRRNWINLRDIPVFSIHGTADETVPYLKGLAANIAYLEGSGLLHPRAESTGLMNYLETVPGGGHTNIYDQAVYANQLNTYWVKTTGLLESMICAVVDAPELTASPDTWSLSPNPVKGRNQIQIRLPQAVSQAFVTVLDATGRIVRQFDQVQAMQPISLPALEPGLYWVKLQDLQQPQRVFPVKTLMITE